jgi:hypothetical protein
MPIAFVLVQRLCSNVAATDNQWVKTVNAHIAAAILSVAGRERATAQAIAE